MTNDARDEFCKVIHENISSGGQFTIVALECNRVWWDCVHRAIGRGHKLSRWAYSWAFLGAPLPCRCNLFSPRNERTVEYSGVQVL